jgi:site-specific DNA recombinase
MPPLPQARPSLAVYARVSSDRQRDEQTIDSQLAALTERLRADGFRVEEAAQFLDDGYSGAVLERPALERLRDQIALGAVDRLYLLDPDRLSRKYAYQVILVEEFQQHGVEVVFLNRPLGQTPEESLFLQLQGMIAEYERAKILERTRRGRRHAARRGDVGVFSQAPYGYRYLAKSAGEAACFQVVLEEARVVREIFDWSGRERASLREIARRLKKRGILSPTGRAAWSPSTIRQLLGNPAYCGRAAYGKRRVIERRSHLRPRRGDPDRPRRWQSLERTSEADWIRIAVPALVGEELFQQVSEEMQEHRRLNRERPSGAKYLLQGLVLCGRCGYAYCGRQATPKRDGGRYQYYRCQGSDKSHFGGQAKCTNRTVPLQSLDDAVWADVQGLLQDPEQLEREYARRLEGAEANPDGERELRQKRIATLERAVDRLIDAYATGVLEKSEVEPRLTETKSRLKRLAEEESAARTQSEDHAEFRMVMEHLQSFCDQVKAGLESADWPTRRRIIRALVRQIEIHDTCVRILYRVNPTATSQPKTDFSHYCSTRAPLAPG